MADISLTATDYKKKDSREKRKKENTYKNYLKDLFLGTKDRWVEIKVESRNEDNEWETDPEEIQYYRRVWRGKRSKDIKKQCNRKLRHTNEEEIYQNGEYKKATEFWWELD